MQSLGSTLPARAGVCQSYANLCRVRYRQLPIGLPLAVVVRPLPDDCLQFGRVYPPASVPRVCKPLSLASFELPAKWVIGELSLLESALTKNTGAHPSRQRSFSPVTQSVLLQSKPFGATICKGTGFLHDPRKQLRSPRCLTLMSGHRGQLDFGPLRKSCLGPTF